MKKMLLFVATSLVLLAFAGPAMAQNAVSQMATTNGGRQVAQCAQAMDKGVSACVKMPVCQP